MSTSWQEFSARLEALGWSQRYLAGRLGIAVSTVSGWRKSGRVPGPAAAFLSEIERRKRISAEAADGLEMPKGRPRGRSIDEWSEGGL